MSQSDKYVQAAERIVKDLNWSCCGALTQVRQTPEDFRKVFKPEERSDTDSWFGMPGNAENQLTRSLALLFMAEIAKEGEEA